MGVSSESDVHTRKSDAQHPIETFVELVIDSLEVLDVHLLAEDHLVETWDEIRVEEPMMEDSEAEDAPDELEVV
jgi:hypothetical protein